MKRLILILALLFASIFAMGQNSPQCITKYYVQVGKGVVNISVDCDSVTCMEFNIYNAAGDHVSHFFYNADSQEEVIQLNLAAFPPGVYFVTTFDGRKTVRFILNNTLENP